MKFHKILTVIFLLSAGLLIFSCENILNINPKGSVSEAVLANEQGVRSLLVGAYGNLDGAWQRWQTCPTNWIYGSCAGGDAHKGSHPYDQSQIFTIQTFQATPTTSFLNNFWRHRYEGVSRANALIKILDEVESIPDEEKVKIEAEAKFLRGHWYFELKRMFNMVPWIDENTTDFSQPNDRDIWPDIENDFKFAMDNLPATQDESPRVNKWAAACYLAKVYSYQKKWQQAKDLYDQIIPNGVTSQGVHYGLLTNFRDNFEVYAEEGSPEAIFFVQQVGDEGTGSVSNSNEGQMLNFPYNSPFLCCGFFQPTQDLVNSYRVDQNGLPMPDNYNNQIVTNDIGVASTQRFDNFYMGDLDPRLDWTVGRRGVPFLDWGPHPGKTWVRDQASSGPYAALKNVYWNYRKDQDAVLTWAPGTAKNPNIIRFADVLLMAAEAEVEVGSLQQALNYVNQVRRRAANSEYVSFDQNRGLAAGTVDSQEEMLALKDISSLAWVIREDTHSTFVYLGGGTGNINNWQEYKTPNYYIGEYAAFPDKDFARKAVHFERKLELALEGHRFFDLVRWDEATEKLNAFFTYEKTIVSNIGAGKFIAGKNEHFPIPQTQIDLSKVEGLPTLKQNDGYN